MGPVAGRDEIADLGNVATGATQAIDLSSTPELPQVAQDVNLLDSKPRGSLDPACADFAKQLALFERGLPGLTQAFLQSSSCPFGESGSAASIPSRTSLKA